MEGFDVFIRLQACTKLAYDPYVHEIARQWAMDRLEYWQLIGETDKWILSELAFSYNHGLWVLYQDLGDRR
jgi:hypothetical protein